MKCPCCEGSGEVEIVIVNDDLNMLSPKERKVYEAGVKLGKFNIYELADKSDAPSLSALRSLADLLFKFGLFEKLGNDKYRITSENERELGVALSNSEKEFLKQLEVLHKRFGYFTTTHICDAMNLSTPIVIRNLKTLYFAGYITKDFSKVRLGQWRLLRTLKGNIIKQPSKVETSNTKLVPVKRKDGVTQCPDGYAEGYFNHLNG